MSVEEVYQLALLAGWEPGKEFLWKFTGVYEKDAKTDIVEWEFWTVWDDESRNPTFPVCVEWFQERLKDAESI